MFHRGIGAPQDYEHAFHYYLKAAGAGHAGAQFNLGSMHYSGEGVAQDFSQAAAWYRKAADQGDPDAQCSLGLMYHEGIGLLQDYSRAAAFCLKAANQGNPRGMFTMGLLYAKGQGVPADLVQAHKWMNLAVAQAPATDHREYADQRNKLAERMTPQEIGDAQRLAREWQDAFDQREP